MSDGNDAVVDRFSAGSYLCQITGAGSTSGTTVSGTECDSSTTGTPSGPFQSSYADGAVDPATGDVYVPDTSAGVVDVFSPAGAYLSQIVMPSGESPGAVAIDSSTGDVMIGTYFGGSVYEWDPGTSTLSQFAPSQSFGTVDGVAVDNDPTSPSYGDVYVADRGNDVVDMFDSSGDFLSSLSGTPSGSFSLPQALAVDPSTGDLYVVDAINGNSATNIDEFSPTGSYEGQVPLASGDYANAVAVSASTGDVYVGIGFGVNVVDVFGPNEVIPDVTTNTPSTIGPTSVTFAGTVNADGTTITDCHFAYIADADYNPSASNPFAGGGTAACTPTPSGSSPESVSSASVTGLTAGTTYDVELFASNSSGTSSGGDVTFATLPTPSIDSAADANLTSTTADLQAQINPNGYDTTYQFQWGTSTSYGNVIPASPADIGAGTSDVSVSQQLTGLTANTEYHWRLEGTSANGTVTTLDHTFVYSTTAAGLPDDRGYEMVTPNQQNGGTIGRALFIAYPNVAADGSKVLFSTITCFGATTSGCVGVRGLAEGQPFLFQRTSTGWTSTSLAVPATVASSAADHGGSADLGDALSAGQTGPDNEDDLYLTNSSDTPTDIGPEYPPADGAQGDAMRGGDVSTSADMSHVVYPIVQFPGPNLFWPFDATNPASDNVTLYEYVGTGNTQPQLVGVTGGAGSTDLVSTCGTAFQGNASDIVAPGEVSEDGSTVFFQAIGGPGCFGSGANASTPVPAIELWARIDGDSSVQLSAPQASSCTTSACQNAAPEDATLQGASTDGSMAYFTSSQQLTDSATQGSSNLYLYDFNAPTGENLIDVSAGDTSGGGPGVGNAAVSADGSHVYFTASGVLTSTPNAQGQSPTAGQNNLYVYERDSTYPNGHLEFITTLSHSDPAWTIDPYVNVTADGQYLVFMSSEDLTSDDTSQSAALQVFEYDAQTAQLQRISIGEDGYNDNGNPGTANQCAGSYVSHSGNGVVGCNAGIVLSTPAYSNPDVAGERRDPTMSDDGSRVFFTSPLALTPHALNLVQVGSDLGDPAYAQNVYEWERAGVGSCPAGQSTGCMYLISDGKDLGTQAAGGAGSPYGFSGVELVGTDSTGDNVFFTSSDQLAPQDDTPGEWNVWDTRVGGGFPYTPPPAGCDASSGACQGTPSGPPAVPTVGTVTFTGPGDQTASTAKLKLTHRVVRGDSFVVSVSVPAKGKLTIAGEDIQRVSRSFGRAGLYRLTVRLSARPRRRLKDRRRLRVVVRVGYRAGGGSVSSARLSVEMRSGRR